MENFDPMAGLNPAGDAARHTRSAETLNECGHKLMNDVRTFIDDAEELLRAVSSLSGETVAGARTKFSESLAQVKSMVADGQDIATEKARLAAAQTDQYVHRNPWQAIGIGLAVGVAIGFLSHRKH